MSEFVSPAAVSFFFLFFVTSLSFEKILKQCQIELVFIRRIVCSLQFLPLP